MLLELMELTHDLKRDLVLARQKQDMAAAYEIQCKLVRALDMVVVCIDDIEQAVAESMVNGRGGVA